MTFHLAMWQTLVLCVTLMGSFLDVIWYDLSSSRHNYGEGEKTYFYYGARILVLDARPEFCTTKTQLCHLYPSKVSPLMVFVMLGRFLDLIWSDGSLFTSCTLRFKHTKKALAMPLI